MSDIEVTLEIPGLDTALREIERQLVAELGPDGDHEVRWVFGGPAAPYAVWVHEVPAQHHVGGWKYIERPLLDSVPSLAAEIVGQVRAGATLPTAMRTVAELKLTAMKEATPVMTGALRDSGHVVQE